ncbi:PREDICTED: uncharacterized protein LOC108364636 isoform X2 [Rhagoletis zephyria]|uniref:uncharacterized protein LOC108364636 isoform X2 n=1 Tax=Rhagoletis zephyria TaxID=28612 RepID=UPI0008114B08|nr:PREDICTED: uncharacterized protein LOC108364636 isoform X2 [Rhagoletis zephyria]
MYSFKKIIILRLLKKKKKRNIIIIMATSSDLLHQPESNNDAEESISNCANSNNLLAAESHADEESIQANVADSEVAATSPGLDENEDVDSKTDFSATPCHENTKEQEQEQAQEQQQQLLEEQQQSSTPPSPSAATQTQEAHSNFSPDEIPEPIKVLDDIISEFEDTSKPANAGGNGENQSEDDGYMSLSRKNMHKQDFENVSQSSISSNAPPTITPTKEFHEFNNTTDVTCPSLETPVDQNIIQSTLPKARPASALTSNNYSSLPCCGARSTSLDGKTTRGVSCNGERNKLGIDISAVHNAVLRGGLAKLPEPILNEHPVTIYPGRYSPPTENKRNPNRPTRILSSVEKHKEVCHILNPLSSISSSSSSSSSNCMGLMDGGKVTEMPHNIMKKPYIRKDKVTNEFSLVSEDEFSDDSIEEQSLSPITSHSSPHKQSGIAWEIHFKSSKKKLKNSSKKKPPRKHAADCIVKTENGGYPLPIVTSDSYYSKDIERAHRREPIVIDALDGADQCSAASADILNHCMYRHTNMLGKGTFIIRRTAKKLPTTMDIFRNESAELDNMHACDQSDYEEFSSMEGHENCKPSDTLSSSSRLSMELVAPLGPPLPSPRDRLSLNLEPQLPNIFTKEILAVHKGDRSSSEELLAPIKKTSLKRETKRRSTDSINTKSSSYEEADDNEPNESAILFSNKNSFDACNMYAYKNDAASCLKGQEFADLRSSTTTTPHTDLAPTLEEEEEQYSDFSYSGAPVKQHEKIDSDINALLRGDIAAVRIVEGGAHPKRPLEFRPGVHKSESAKEMLLSQSAFGPLPPSPPSSNPDLFDYDALPLPPSPKDALLVSESNRSLVKSYKKTTAAEIHTPSSLGDERRNRDNMNALRYLSNDLPPPPPLPPPAFENMAPIVPPHRGHSVNTMKSWSIDSHYKKKSPKMLGYGSGITTPTGSQYDGSYSTKRYVNYGTKRSLKQSPREELRLQTSCSLPETPIFARGSCDIPRTPFRRQPESSISGSRTAPRSSTSHSINMGNTMGGISGGGNTFGAGMCRQRSMNHALASNEMLRLAGAPARGWYPKQRTMRPASTENIDRLSSSRVWDSAAGMSGTGHSRKPLTLPPNLTPSFLNKSPREALRRVTSLLIAKKKNTKERKGKPYSDTTLDGNLTFDQDTPLPPPKDSSRNFNNTSQKPQKKKGLFKSLWKKTKHFSLDQ